ncbi:Tetratricopeptide repeat-containing protein [Streptomyces zhaozhouensis]|uniref:Tetratricopeptide repeat-containing protein n=1 Tax=Streptomyces zhaozhouensis TaxID=1300267 RepID=A0A286DPP7_9ACTN|nr:tetratricopeptide repeat protein [Streptomyces zhaozhouensis]SOD60652.1 Tetratricopeptide repeat-containing protein [Streptomyces zhaozhouensis]
MNEPAHGESAPRRDTHAELSGTSRDTVQAGSVSGGVHFHGHRESHREHDERARGAPAPRQLPGDVRGFVNRADELGQLDAVLPERDGEPTAVSVWVIAGTAGAGKTSLALHWAHRVKERFPDGQLYINLRGYDPREPVTAEEALRRFLPALGVPADAVPSDGEAAADLYRSLLADRRVLVVLDNAATVGQVRPLLPGGEHCLTVVTSRNRLSGLAIRDGAHRLTLGMLPESEAVALLRVVTAGFRRQDGEEALAELSRLCARLPLALRIAAERAASRPHMRLEELIDELRDGSALWDALSSGDEEEAEAVRTVFAWSYRALPADASRVFRLLGLHPGPDFGAGAVAALADLPVRRARQTLDVLVGAHLVEQTGPDRYAFHDLLRVYAAGLAREEREEPVDEASTDPLRRLVNWYLHTAESARRWIEPDEAPVPLPPCDDAARPLVFTTYDQAVEWSERERANVPAAVRSAGEAGWHGLAWRLAAVWYDAQPPSAPAADWLPVGALGLGAARRAGDRPREAWFLDSLGTACRRLNRPEESRARHREALAVWRELGDARGEALSWNLLGLLELRGRRLAEAERAFHHALDVFREVGDERWESILLANRGRARWDAGLLGAAADDVGPALAAHRAGGRAASVGDALSVLSAVHLDRDEPGPALDAAREAVEIALELRDHTLEAYWLLALGAAERALGAYGPALESYQRSAVLHRRLGDRGREALAWHGTGCVYARMERPEDAAAFHRRAAAAHRELGDAWHEALALEGLAAALDAAHPEESHHCRTEVLRLTAAFDDPRARELRARVAPESG